MDLETQDKAIYAIAGVVTLMWLIVCVALVVWLIKDMM